MFVSGVFRDSARRLKHEAKRFNMAKIKGARDKVEMKSSSSSAVC